MRKTADRIRHSILFEIIGLATCTPLAAWILDKGMLHLGTLNVALSLTAMLMNYLYNLVFDLVLVRLGRPVNVRPVRMRVLHAILFEISLILITTPMVAWWLDMTLWIASLTDLRFTLYFLVYTFVYNWAYDVIFPMPVASKITDHY